MSEGKGALIGCIAAAVTFVVLLTTILVAVSFQGVEYYEASDMEML